MQAAMVKLDGQEWLFEEEELTLKDWFVIKASTGLTRLQFLQGLMDEDPTALQALIWFLRRRDEPALSVGAVNFKPALLSVEPVPEPGADPTQAASQTPQPSQQDEPRPSAPSPSQATYSVPVTDGSTSSPVSATSALLTSTV